MKFFVFVFLLFFISLSLQAQQPDKKGRVETYNLSDGRVALDGYDPVSYYTNDEPKKGASEISYTYESATYYFLSKANRSTLKKLHKNLSRPMGDDGSKVKVDLETYKIVDGKLYLFYNSFWNNTLPDWNEKALKAITDNNWDTLIKRRLCKT
jgi:YHS domain-containing protein